MKATIENGKLMIEVDLLDEAAVSASGKSLHIVDNAPVKGAARYLGGAVTLKVEAYIPNPAFKKA